MNKLQRILVVDGSRVVRATLIKHLKDDFEILEEGSGEAAWQKLVLDAGITAIIAGIHTPKLELNELLSRLRTSSMARLKNIPYIMIVSDLDDLADRESDRARGVAGFITKTMRKSEIVAYLRALLDPCEIPSIAGKTTRNTVLSGSGRILNCKKFNIALTGFPFADPKIEPLAALVFVIDNRETLINQFGKEITVLIAERFASLLEAKVAAFDLIGHCQAGRLGIISHCVDLKQGVRFGKQVCKSLASGQIVIRGEKLKISASVGVSSSSEDGLNNANELLALADKRLDQALVCGGNTVSTEYRPGCPWHNRSRTSRALYDALEMPDEDDLSANIGKLGMKILPLLRAIDHELELGLPLANIRYQLEQRAEIEDESVSGLSGIEVFEEG
ncbi:MAG: diguanylate cyclase [Betaproteobacteria bacterium]